MAVALREFDDVWSTLAPLAQFDEPAEERRLEALREYDILDTGPEEAYDRVVGLARALFDAPIAAIGLMDRARLWFKARDGFDASEEPRDIVFCDHVIRQNTVLAVPDLAADRRFADNPFVAGGPRLRFYAGAPVVTPAGERIGTVCVMSPEARAGFGPAECDRLAALAGIVGHELELRLQAARARRRATERGLLLQAIERRLRGGLQMVACALQAQALRNADDGARRALLEAADRVTMIEAVHQQLFQGGDVFQTDAREYLLALVGNLQDAVMDQISGRAVTLDLDSELRLDADRLPTLGLVVTELLSNALRHGSGEVEVEVRRDGGELLVTATDHGGGWHADFASPEGLCRPGLWLVSLLSLPGGLSVDPSQRKRVTVRMRA